MLCSCGYYSLIGGLPFLDGKANTIQGAVALVYLASRALNLPMTLMKTLYLLVIAIVDKVESKGQGLTTLHRQS